MDTKQQQQLRHDTRSEANSGIGIDEVDRVVNYKKKNNNEPVVTTDITGKQVGVDVADGDNTESNASTDD